MTVHLLQALKQTHGYQCGACGALWDGYQVPCPIDVALRHMKANAECFRCHGTKLFVLMPWRYEELKAEAASADGPVTEPPAQQPEPQREPIQPSPGLTRNYFDELERYQLDRNYGMTDD